MRNNTEDWYKAIFNNSKDAIFVIDFSKEKIGKFIDVNREACRQLKYSKKELLQLSPNDIAYQVKGNNEPNFYKDAFANFKTKRNAVFESVHVTKTGKKFPVRVNTTIVKYNGGYVIIASVQDITKIKQNEEQLKKIESTYQSFIANTFDGIYKFELQKPVSIKSSLDKQVKAIYNYSVLIDCNNTFAKMYGYRSAKGAIGKLLKSIYGNKLNKENYKVLADYVKNGYSLERAVTQEKNAKGKVKYFSNNAVGIVENGMLKGSWGTQNDITESVEATNRLKIMDEKFRSIFEKSPLGLLHFNNKGEIVEVNERFVEIMGSSREALIGFNSLKNAGDKEMRRAVKDMLTIGKGFYKGNYVSTTGKKKTSVKVWFFGLRNEQGEIIGGTAILEDITVQIENEIKLQLSENKYRTIFDSVLEGVFVHEKGTARLIEANNVALKMYGYTFDEIAKCNLGTLSSNVPPYTVKEALKYLNNVDKSPQLFEWHARRKDNSLFWAEISMRLGKVNRIERIIMSVKDITKRKEAEEELLRSEARYRNLIRTLKDPIIVHSAGKLVFVNDAALKIAGIKRKEDLIGRSVLDFVHPDYREFAIKRMLNSGNILPAVEEVFLTADGKYIDVEVSGSRLLFKGKPAVQLIIRDITDRKRNERIQTSLFKISQAAVNAVSLDEFFKEMHTIIKSLMPADNFYVALYNKENEMLTFPYFVDELDEVVPQGQSVGRGFTAYVLKTGKSLIIDDKVEAKLLKAGKIEIVGADSKIWIGIILKYKEEIIGVLGLQDYHNAQAYGENEKQILTFVSEQIAQAIVKIRADEINRRYVKELETAKNEIEHNAEQLNVVNKELRISEEKLKETNANKDKFFSILSHDLRSPFTALLGYSQFLEEAYYDLTDEEKLSSISSLHKTSRNIFELLTGLLEWSRTQTGSMEFNPGKLFLHKIATETISILDMNAAAKQIKIVNRINSRSFAIADKNMVRTIFRNLLSNALKFTPRNGRIEISGKSVKGFMQITVSDNGIGIVNSDMDMLFKIEEHHTTLGTEHEVGTGVGLILCKELVAKNGGKIWVESKIGVGSKFIFTLRKS